MRGKLDAISSTYKNRGTRRMLAYITFTNYSKGEMYERNRTFKEITFKKFAVQHCSCKELSTHYELLPLITFAENMVAKLVI